MAAEDITINEVTLNIPEFLGLFPHLQAAYDAQKLSDDAIQFHFETVAEQFGVMFPYDPVHGVNTRKRAYYLATCHLCTLALCGQQFWVLTASYRRGGKLYTSPSYHPWG